MAVSQVAESTLLCCPFDHFSNISLTSRVKRPWLVPLLVRSTCADGAEVKEDSPKADLFCRTSDGRVVNNRL